MQKCSTDVIRRVFTEDGDGFLEVGPWGDDITLPELRTIPNKQSEEWFGRISVVGSPAFMAELGKALLATAKEFGWKEEQ